MTIIGDMTKFLIDSGPKREAHQVIGMNRIYSSELIHEHAHDRVNATDDVHQVHTANEGVNHTKTLSFIPTPS
jgi:hypothetical protein